MVGPLSFNIVRYNSTEFVRWHHCFKARERETVKRVRVCDQMDPKVYRAALEGSWTELAGSDGWSAQTTHMGNTVLHVHLRRPRQRYSKSIPSQWHQKMLLRYFNIPPGSPPVEYWEANAEFMKNVLGHEALQGGIMQSLLWHENANGEIPLHLAAKFGHVEAVEEFLQRANLVSAEEVRKMLLKSNTRKDTALHEAARAGHAQIVQLLVEADPTCPYEANELNETPLYLAAESRSFDCVTELLDTCDSSALAYDHKGPCGRTALHVLIHWRNAGILLKILAKDESLIRLRDENGSTPLHCAAAENKVRSLLVLLEYDKQTNESAVYIKDKKGRTPLHIATLHRCWDCIKVLISYRPDCIEVLDDEGQNMLHYAAKWACVKRFEYLLELQPEQELIRLINDKDLSGNTPLHLIAANIPYMRCGCYRHVPDFMKGQQQYLKSFNNQNLTVGDMVKSHYLSERYLAYVNHRILLRRAIELVTLCGRIRRSNGDFELSDNMGSTTEERLKKRVVRLWDGAQSQLIVAALVATVSFTAGFTLPGGFNQNPGPDIGMAVMTKKAAFQAFVVSDAVALTFSCFAVFLYFIAAGAAGDGGLESEIIWLKYAQFFTKFSIGAMMVAFATGVYVVIPHTPLLQTMVFIISALFLGLYIFLVFASFDSSPLMELFPRHAKIRGVNYYG